MDQKLLLGSAYSDASSKWDFETCETLDGISIYYSQFP